MGAMTTVIVGQGLAGTLVGLEAERRGLDFWVVDLGSGKEATRAAAGLFNPLTGPRLTPDLQGWEKIVPHYRELEQRLGVGLCHPLPLVRPLTGTKTTPDKVQRSAPGWSAEVVPDRNGSTSVRIEGGGWVDLPALVDAARNRWNTAGRLEERLWTPEEGRGRRIVWTGGPTDLAGPVWSSVPGVRDRWQPVRGDVLTVRVPGLDLGGAAEVGTQFLLPLGGDLFRWGATHESDVDDREFRPAAREFLERTLALRLGDRPFEVTDHRWGIRPSSRAGIPLVQVHPDESGWVLFNGFGGRGVSQVPRWLDRLFED